MGCLIKTLILKNQAGAYVPAFSLGIKNLKGGFTDLSRVAGLYSVLKSSRALRNLFYLRGDFMLQCEKCQCEKFYLTNKNNILACQRCLYPVHPLRYMEHFRREMKKVVRAYG